MQSTDREMRKSKLRYVGWIACNKELDEIYDKLVKVRHNMARKLGFENFILLHTPAWVEQTGMLKMQKYIENR